MKGEACNRFFSAAVVVTRVSISFYSSFSDEFIQTHLQGTQTNATSLNNRAIMCKFCEYLIRPFTVLSFTARSAEEFIKIITVSVICNRPPVNLSLVLFTSIELAYDSVWIYPYSSFVFFGFNYIRSNHLGPSWPKVES